MSVAPKHQTLLTNGRVTTITTPEGSTNYSYACQSNVSNISKPSTGSGADEGIDFTYDGTLLTSMTQNGVLNQTISYTYNNDFLPKSMSYAGQTTQFAYNDDNELIKSGAFTIRRDKQGRRIFLNDGYLHQKRLFNRYGELRRLNDNAITVKLFRNKAGQITQKIERLQGQRAKRYRYTYDNRGRLTQVKERRNIVEAYTYDANGNRKSATVHGTSITTSYTLDDNLVVYGDNTYKYDDDGYLQEKTTPNGTTTYSYGTMGELLSVTTPAKAISYQHNALNQRVAKLINGQVVEKYLWADLTTLLAIYDSNDNLVQRFEYADSRMPVAMTDTNGQKYYLHYDQVGSLRAVSDSSHNIVKEIVYDTFGNILTDSNPNFKVPFGFAGGLYDADTKLTRFGYRDYDAYTGKWTAKDPIGFSGGDSNLYGYVLGDPVDFVDPEGRNPLLLLFLFGVGLSEYAYTPNVGEPTNYYGPTEAAWVLPLAPLTKPIAPALMECKITGISSPLFGHSGVRGGTPGLFNKPGNIKLGWSSTSSKGGGYAIRLGLGKNGNKSLRHIDIPGTFVPNRLGNPIVKNLISK